MIPPQVALVVWIVVAVAFFAMLTPLRAFLLTYVIGYLVLPVEVGSGITFKGAIVISQSLRIDKLTACHIGVILGALIFSPQVFRRFKWHWVDAAFGIVVGGLFATSMVNGLGPKDGLSNAVSQAREWLPLIVLSRMFITNVGELYEAMRVMVGGAALYAVLAVLEFRFSPQAHRLVYGYFQHDFSEFARYDHFRPVGFLHHAIELSFLMGTSAAMAGWLWYKGLMKKPLWGTVPAWGVFAAIFVGLLVTMTYSGYAAFALCVGCLALMTVARTRWLLWLLPALAMVWMVGRYTGVIDASLLLKGAGMVDTRREASLEYRLTSEQIHLDYASSDVWLGKGGTDAMIRGADGRVAMAVDAWWMIQLTFYGLAGLGGWYLVWCAGIWAAFWRWKKLTPDLRTTATITAVLIGAQFIDFLFNAFPSPFLMILNMGLLSVLLHYHPVAAPMVGGPRVMAEAPAVAFPEFEDAFLARGGGAS